MHQQRQLAEHALGVVLVAEDVRHMLDRDDGACALAFSLVNFTKATLASEINKLVRVLEMLPHALIDHRFSVRCLWVRFRAPVGTLLVSSLFFLHRTCLRLDRPVIQVFK